MKSVAIVGFKVVAFSLTAPVDAYDSCFGMDDFTVQPVDVAPPTLQWARGKRTDFNKIAFSAMGPDHPAARAPLAAWLVWCVGDVPEVHLR